MTTEQKTEELAAELREFEELEADRKADSLNYKQTLAKCQETQSALRNAKQILQTKLSQGMSTFMQLEHQMHPLVLSLLRRKTNDDVDSLILDFSASDREADDQKNLKTILQICILLNLLLRQQVALHPYILPFLQLI